MASVARRNSVYSSDNAVNAVRWGVDLLYLGIVADAGRGNVRPVPERGIGFHYWQTDGSGQEL